MKKPIIKLTAMFFILISVCRMEAPISFTPHPIVGGDSRPDGPQPVYAIDGQGDVLSASEKETILTDTAHMDINNIDLPLENDGTTGLVGQGYYPTGTLMAFLFSGGLAACGYVNGQPRVSWIVKPTLAREWRPGQRGMDPTHPMARFYRADATDNFGSPAYVDWADAVSLGADFQDLNEDGIYDPNIDRPDILGDRMLWTIYNDDTPYRYFFTYPMGLEIHQTTWAFTQAGPLDDVIFFRFRLINTDTNTVDSLIFSIWEDPDLGDYHDDLVGCDPESHLGFAYNDGIDGIYGVNPPAFGVKLLQGAIVDAPGDTAYRYRGPFFGTDTVLDKANLPMSSFTHFIIGSPIMGDPQSAASARCYQEGGFDVQCTPIIPGIWGTGGASSDPRFFYSGDPVSGTGWIDNAPDDKRYMVNMGQFQMAPGDTQDIIFAYVLGRGSDHLSSITEMRQNAQAAQDNIGIPVPPTPLGIEHRASLLADRFELYPNYPNPFNPKTTIEFMQPQSGFVTLKVYNILGEEVATLVSKKLAEGIYKYEWDASGLASGVYVYRIQADNYVEAKKMVLMK